jgi:SAM-dependent methyltransferase
MAQEQRKTVDHYGAQYGHFETELLAEIRRDAFGTDIGQNGWLTAEEQDLFMDWLGLGRGAHLLDVACGSGGPTLRIAETTGCRVTGIDLHADAIEVARRDAARKGLAGYASFQAADATRPLPFDDGSFDAVMCIDAINHLPDRAAVLAEWHRVLRPGGRVLFTDPIVVTGPLTNEEIAIRASIGFFLFVPDGTDRRLLEEADFTVERVEDCTANMARNARGWLEARARRERDLRAIEGDATFDGQQRFFATATLLADEKRLSRHCFVARRTA